MTVTLKLYTYRVLRPIDLQGRIRGTGERVYLPAEVAKDFIGSGHITMLDAYDPEPEAE